MLDVFMYNMCNACTVGVGYFIQWGYSGQGIQWGYSGDTVGIQWGYSGDTVGIQWGYSGDTVGIQGDTVGIQGDTVGIQGDTVKPPLWRRHWDYIKLSCVWKILTLEGLNVRTYVCTRVNVRGVNIYCKRCPLTEASLYMQVWMLVTYCHKLFFCTCSPTLV